MPCNLARSLPRNLIAWCCYIALRIGRVHPALQGSPEGQDLAAAIHSSHKEFLAPSNNYHGFNHGECVNHKRLRESQQVPHQFDPQLPDLGAGRDYLDIESENDIRSTHVTKRPMTVQDGYFATPIPQSLNHDSDTSSPFGATTYDRSGLSGLKDHLAGHQFNHLQNSLFPSASSTSLHPNFFISEPILPLNPPHEAGKPWDDLINVPGLHNELLYSEFGKIPDSTWHSTFGHQVLSQQSTIQNLPPEPPFPSTSSHGFESAHGDLSVSQLSTQFNPFDDSLWVHSPWPEPQLTSQQSQLQSLLEHSASQYTSHSTQHNLQGQASHQIQIHQMNEDHTYSQGFSNGGSLLSHFNGDSSEKMEKNNGAILHASTEWDPELAAINIPDYSKDDNLLKKFMKDFNNLAHGKLEVKALRQVVLSHSDLNLLPVAFFQDSKSPVYLIRVLLAPEYCNPKSPNSFASRNYPVKILNQFYRLIHWLLFINTAALRRLHAPGSMSETSDEADYNARLIEWFFEQTFEPSNSWPVVGKIPRQVAHAPGKTFGPIQKIIITCLSSPCQINRELQTAVMLVRLYYEYQCPKILEELGIFQLDDFKSLINNAIQFKMRIDNGFDKSKWIENLGNFPVLGLQSIPKVLQPLSFHKSLFMSHYKVEPGKEEGELREYIRKIISPSRRVRPISELSRVNFDPEDYPVLIANRGINSKLLKHGMIWPRNHKNDKSFLKKKIESRLNNFLNHLNLCFSKLMECKDRKGIQPEDLTEQLFFRWLHKVLFNPGHDKLPLLGEFDLEKGRKADSFSAQDFNEIQALLHNLITDINPHQRNFQASLSVLGYWLKNEQSELYNQLFKNDDEYWENLIQLIIKL